MAMTKREARNYLKAHAEGRAYGTTSRGAVWVRAVDADLKDTVYIEPDAAGTFDQDDLDFALKTTACS